jgi:hypothetical protein
VGVVTGYIGKGGELYKFVDGGIEGPCEECGERGILDDRTYICKECEN